LDFAANGGKRQGRGVPQSLWVEPGAKPPVWKTQSAADHKKKWGSNQGSIFFVKD
jgi:hypothetical protein